MDQTPRQDNPLELQPTATNPSKIKVHTILLYVGLFLAATALGVSCLSLLGQSVFRTPVFSVTGFTLEKEVQEYEYIENTVTYSGSGYIVTEDRKNDYLVLLETKTISGGMEEGEDSRHHYVVVHEGKGTFSTYEYGDVGTLEKPVYEFQILGYIPFNKVEQEPTLSDLIV